MSTFFSYRVDEKTRATRPCDEAEYLPTGTPHPSRLRQSSRGFRANLLCLNAFQIKVPLSGLIDGTTIALVLAGKGNKLNQMKNLSTRIGGAVLTLAFIFGISAAAGMTAQAQDRRDRDDRQDR